MEGRAHPRDPRTRQAQTRSQVCNGPLRVRVYDLGSTFRSERRAEPAVLRVEWPGPDAGPRVAPAAFRTLEVLLEVGEVVARARVHGTQPARFLGAARVSR